MEEASGILAFLVENWGTILLCIIALAAVISGLYKTEEMEEDIITRFGKYHKVATPGLNIKIPFVDEKHGSVSYQVERMPVSVITVTLDKVTVEVDVTLLYRAIPGRAYDAYYKAAEMEKIAEDYITDVVRSKVPEIELDTAMGSKEEIADALQARLTTALLPYGYEVDGAVVKNVAPDAEVQKEMNEINAAKRRREAARETAEAEKELLIGRARGEKESKKLQGEGVAEQRKAIINGLKTSIDELSETTGIDAATVMQTLLMTNYFDTLRDVSANANTNTIMFGHGPGAPHDIMQQLTAAIVAAPPKNGKANGTAVEAAAEA